MQVQAYGYRYGYGWGWFTSGWLLVDARQKGLRGWAATFAWTYGNATPTPSIRATKILLLLWWWTVVDLFWSKEICRVTLPVVFWELSTYIFCSAYLERDERDKITTTHRWFVRACVHFSRTTSKSKSKSKSKRKIMNDCGTGSGKKGARARAEGLMTGTLHKLVRWIMYVLCMVHVWGKLSSISYRWCICTGTCTVQYFFLLVVCCLSQLRLSLLMNEWGKRGESRLINETMLTLTLPLPYSTGE